MAASSLTLDILLNTKLDTASLKTSMNSVGATVDSLQTSLNKVNTKAMSAGFNEAVDSAQASITLQKTALAGMIASGQGSSETAKKIRASLAESTGEANKLNLAMQQVEKEFGQAQQKAQGLGGAFQFNQITQASQTIAGTLDTFAKPFVALDTATAQMKTLGAEAAAMAPNLRQAAIVMSKDLPFAAAELQTTMFDALASGVQGGEEGLKKFAITSAKLATGGSAAIADSTKLLAGNLNAYGKSAEEAARFSDIFFNTVNYGVVSIPELSANLANVIPTAAAAGVELEGVGASIALMTSKGIPAAQSTTKLNALLLEIQKPGAALAPILKAAGVSLESLNKDDLPVTLEKISGALKKTGATAVSAFSSSEASAAFNTLAGDIGAFKKTFEDVANTTGSTDFAFTQMTDSIDVQLKQLLSTTQAYIIDGVGALGDGFVFAAGAATQLTPAIAGIAGLKQIIPDGTGEKVTEFAASITEKVLPALGFQSAASIEAASAAHVQALASAESAAAAESAALIQAEASVEQSLAAQAQAAAALEVVSLKEAELAAIIEIGGADATAAAEALASAELKASAAIEVAAAKQAEAAASVEVATGLGIEVAAANASVIATGEAAVAADASAFSFSAMWAAATGPVALVIAGVVAVGVALVLLYNYVAPVKTAFDAIADVAVAVFEGLWSTIKEVGSVLFSVGEILFDLWITPFKILYAVVQPIISSLFTFIGSLLNLSSAGEKSTTIIQKVQSAFEVLHQGISFVLASLQGVIAGITTFAETATKVIDDILHLNFAGAVEDAKAGGQKIGAAVAGGFNEKMSEIKTSDAAKKFEKDFTDATKGIEESLKQDIAIKAKINVADSLNDLESSLVDAQSQLKPIEVKIKAGTATDDEKASFDKLSKSIAATTSKIKEIAPEAVTGQKSILSSNGELITSYDINTKKLAEIGANQKKTFGDEAQKEQKKYSASITNLSTLYDQQKTKLTEVKKAIDEANAKGDTKGAEKLSQEFKQLSIEANKTGAQVTKSFEDGAKAGLLTDDAIVKVGKSLGFTAEQAFGAAKKMNAIAVEAAKAALDVKKLGEAFTAIKTGADTAFKDAALGSAGAEDAFKKLDIAIKSANALRKKDANEAAKIEKDALAEFNRTAVAKDATQIKSFAEAKALTAKTLADQRKIQNDNLKIAADAERTAQKNNVVDVQKNAQSKGKIVSEARLDDFENQRFNEERATKNSLLSESEKVIKILEINQKYNKLKLEEQIRYENSVNLIKGTVDATFEAAKKKRIDALEDSIRKSEQTTIDNINAEKGKALVKDHELQLKLNDEALKKNVDNTKTAIDLIDKRKVESSAQEFIRLDDLNAAKISQIAAQGQLEINELLNKNDAVLKAEESLKAALAKGDDVLIDAALELKNTAIRNALDKDAAIIASNQRTNASITNQNKQAVIDRRTYELSLKEDSAEKERELSLIEIKKTYDAELEAARGNERLKTEALIKAASARAAVEDKYLQATNVLYKKAIDFQTNLLKSFSDDAIAERKRVLKEDTLAFEDSKDALFQSLKAKTLDEKGYYAAVGDLEAKQAKLESDSINFLKIANASFIESMSQSAAETQQKVKESSKKLRDLNALHSDDLFEQTAITAKQTEAQNELYGDLAANMGISFISMVASGKDAVSAAGDIAISAAADFLNSMIPVWVAGIFGSFATSGPIGIALAAAATGVLMGLVQVAKAGLTSGAHDGFVDIPHSGTGKRPSSEDTIPIWIRPHESIINPKATAVNYDVLNFINTTNRPAHEYYAKMGYDSPEIKLLVMPAITPLILEKEKLSTEVHLLRENYERDTIQYRENMDAIRKQMINVSIYKDEVNNNKEIVTGLRIIADTVIKENTSLKSQLRLIDREQQLREKKAKPEKVKNKPQKSTSSNWI